MTGVPERHEKAAKAHEQAVIRHHDAAAFWDSHGDADRAELERRNEQIEAAAARLELDRAVLERRGPAKGSSE